MAWLSGYTFRKKGAVNATTAGPLTNYQLEIVVGESNGASGASVHCNGNCQDFPNDIRFTKEDGETMHDYWIDTSSLEGDSPNRKISMWVEIASIPSSGLVNTYIYYGKDSDIPESNGEGTFEFFDDFDGSELDTAKTEGDILLSGDAGKYEAWPGITKTTNGDLFVAYRTCDSNTHGVESTGRAVIRKSTDDGQTWGAEAIIADEAGKDDRVTSNLLTFNYNETERIICCYHVDTMANKAISYCVYSDDHGVSWSSRKLIYGDVTHEGHIAGQTILTSTNKLLVPVCVDKATSWGEAVFESSDGGDTWTRYNVVAPNSGRNEFTIIETKTGGSYTGGIYGIFRRNDGAHYDYATSTDYGHTWSAFAEETDMPVESANPCFLFRLSNGKILAAYTRTIKRLVSYETNDECITWTYKNDILTTQSISYYAAIAELSPSNLVFAWCENGSSSDVYINYVDYPLEAAKWNLDTGTVSVADSILTLTANPTYLLSAAKEHTQPGKLVARARFDNDSEQQWIAAKSEPGSEVDGNRITWLKYSQMRKAVQTDNANQTQQNDAHEGLGSYHTYESHWKTDEVKFYDDSALKATLATNVPTLDLYLFLRRSGASAFNIDWVFTGKYASPEPTWGSWGGEAEQITKESSVGISIDGINTKESSLGLSVSVECENVSTLGLTIVERITKASSVGISIDGINTKESSVGISIEETNTKASSVGLSIQESLTKGSSLGISIIGRITKESSVGLTIFEPVLEKGLFYGKLGDIILETVEPESFRISEEINRIPSFEFEVANSEANRTAIAANPTALFKIYWQHHGVENHIFTGIINADGIEYVSLTSIKITGFSSYAKLGWPLFKHLDSADAEPVNIVLDYNGAYTDYTAQANSPNINDVIVTFGTADHCFYIGEANPFWGLQIKYSTKGIPGGANVIVEYSKGNGVWAELHILDETYAFTEEPGTYDIIIPHPPSDWAREGSGGYSKFWIRWRVVSGSYSTSPKLDQIHTVNVDVYRVFYLDTSARAILLDVLDGTEYSMDATDACPEDEINIWAEYESPLRVIAAIPAALTWTDTGGSKKSYQWWIDDAKKVHIKKKRGTTHPDDITGDLTIFNNLIDYFNISNRLIGFAKRDGLSQIRAIVEDKPSQTTHALREFPVPKTDLGKYITLKASLEKDIAMSKNPMQRIKGAVTTEFWGTRGYEVGDTVTLHQGEWVVEEDEFQIVKADIGPLLTQLDLGISREHLEGLKSNLKRTLDISNVQMHGSTSLLTAGPETSNYERKSDGSVFSSKLKIEIPSEVVKTHKVLLSWTIGKYRASVNDKSKDVPPHNHGGSALIGGEISADVTGDDGGFTPDVSPDGLHTPVVIGGTHAHHLEGAVGYAFDGIDGRLVTSHQVAGTNHRHPMGATGGPSGSTEVCAGVEWDEWCDACNYWLVSSQGFDSVASTSHTHPNTGKYTGYTAPVMTIPVTQQANFLCGVQWIKVDIYSEVEDPVHEHTGTEIAKHDHVGVAELDHAHDTPGIPGHTDHAITAENSYTVSTNYGIHEEAAGTVLELLINSEKVGEYSGAQTEIRIDGYLTSSNNTVEIQPITTETGKKGSTTISASGILFIEPKKF